MADEPRPPFQDFPDQDSDWSQDQWKFLLEHLERAGFASWREICSLVLGHLNPSQVGTSIASKKSFQRHFLDRKTWQAVREWHFDQPGVCEDCGTRLELQADHIIPKEIVGKVGREVAEEKITDRLSILKLIGERMAAELEDGGYDKSGTEELRNAIEVDLCDAILEGGPDPREYAEIADRLDNMLLRCRRCNVIRRPSHKQGGKTHLTAEAALMWILLVKRPKTYQEFCQGVPLLWDDNGQH